MSKSTEGFRYTKHHSFGSYRSPIITANEILWFQTLLVSGRWLHGTDCHQVQYNRNSHLQIISTMFHSNQALVKNGFPCCHVRQCILPLVNNQPWIKGHLVSMYSSFFLIYIILFPTVWFTGTLIHSLQFFVFWDFLWFLLWRINYANTTAVGIKLLY